MLKTGAKGRGVWFQETNEEGPIPWANKENLCFMAEQVSHHPPSKFLKFEFSPTAHARNNVHNMCVMQSVCD